MGYVGCLVGLLAHSPVGYQVLPCVHAVGYCLVGPGHGGLAEESLGARTDAGSLGDQSGPEDSRAIVHPPTGGWPDPGVSAGLLEGRQALGPGCKVIRGPRAGVRSLWGNQFLTQLGMSSGVF